MGVINSYTETLALFLNSRKIVGAAGLSCLSRLATAPKNSPAVDILSTITSRINFVQFTKESKEKDLRIDTYSC